MPDTALKNLVGVFYDVLVKVESFIFIADSFILYCEVDFAVSIILGKLFLVIE